jgi:hypothetical protein
VQSQDWCQRGLRVVSEHAGQRRVFVAVDVGRFTAEDLSRAALLTADGEAVALLISGVRVTLDNALRDDTLAMLAEVDEGKLYIGEAASDGNLTGFKLSRRPELLN